MMYALPRPLRQLLALTLLIATIAAIGLLTVLPVASRIAELQDRIEQERDVLGRLSNAPVDESAAISVAQQSIATNIAGLVTPGESEPIRVAAIQSKLGEILSSQRLRPRSTRNLSVREKNNLRLVGVQLQLSAPIEQVQAVLLAIESTRPLLFVDALHILPITQFGGIGEDTRGMLDVRLDVYGVETPTKGP